MDGNRETQSPRRVVFVINTLTMGGTERHLVRLLGGLRKTERWDVSVYCLDRRGELIPAMEAMGIDVAGLARPWTSSPLHVLRSLLALYRYLRKEQPAVAHCYLDLGGFLGGIAARLARVPHVVATRRMLRKPTGGMAEMKRRAMFAVSDRCSDAVVAVSDVVRRQAIQEGTPDRKVVTVYNAVALPTAHPSRRHIFSGDPVFGSVGSLYPIKGHRYLIEAIPAVLASLPEAHFVLMGDGSERPKLQELARSLDVGERVEFLGVRTDATSLLHELDVFVLPSLVEGMPNAVLEAMAAGVPVVATRVGGVPEIVSDGDTGLLVEGGSPEQLASALVRLGRDAALRDRLAEKARSVVDAQFSPDREIADTERVYFRLLGDEPSDILPVHRPIAVSIDSRTSGADEVRTT